MKAQLILLAVFLSQAAFAQRPTKVADVNCKGPHSEAKFWLGKKGVGSFDVKFAEQDGHFSAFPGANDEEMNMTDLKFDYRLEGAKIYLKAYGTLDHPEQDLDMMAWAKFNSIAGSQIWVLDGSSATFDARVTVSKPGSVSKGPSEIVKCTLTPVNEPVSNILPPISSDLVSMGLPKTDKTHSRGVVECEASGKCYISAQGFLTGTEPARSAIVVDRDLNRDLRAIFPDVPADQVLSAWVVCEETCSAFQIFAED